MRIFVKSLLAAVLVVALAGAPAVAAPAGVSTVPFGVILQADRASVGSDRAASGSSVFDGETLRTDAEGLMRVRFGMSQAYLLPQTQALVHQTDGGFAANLQGGAMILTSVEGETFRVLADGASIRPASSQPTVAQVTMVSSKELLLVSRKGALEVSMGGDVKTVPEGTSYRMIIQPTSAAGSDPAAQTPVPTGKNHFVFVLGGGAISGAAVGVYLAVRSPSEP